ncbi:MAG: 4Fe-4S binding protein [Calditrichota bacterium]
MDTWINDELAQFKKATFLLILRRISQFGIGTILFQSYLGVFETKQVYAGPLKQGCVPGLTCHACPTSYAGCPIGLIQHFAAIHRFPFLLIGVLGLIGLIAGRFVCGWLCPWGLLQDVMFVFKRIRVKIPLWLDYFKYATLVGLVFIIPYYTHQHWFSKLCPVGGLIAGIPWTVWNPDDPVFEAAVVDPASIGTMFFIKMTILGFFLVIFLFIKRPFCRTVCPLGATYGLFNKVSLVSLKVRTSCPECGQCSDLCPMDLCVNEDFNSDNCIRCLDCLQCKHVDFYWNLPWKSREKPEGKQVVTAFPVECKSECK